MRAEARFRAMGSDAHVVIVGGPADATERARLAIERLEGLWSRFIPDSEVSRLNASAGTPVIVSDETFELVARALQARRITGGAFDPTMLDELVAAGYDRSFELIGTGSAEATPPGPRERADIHLDPVVRSVTLEPGAGFDPGGIGKGLAADLVVTMLLDAGARGALVSLGGDVRVEGEPPSDRGWTIDIEDPFDGSPVLRLAIAGGAVATSSRVHRAWSDGERTVHHLLDPSTGSSAWTGLAQVSVVAGEGWEAEALCKAAFLGGSDAIGLMQGWGVTGVVIDDAGLVSTTDDIEGSLA